jgi:tetratricopeptide (TPR) repeat protein
MKYISILVLSILLFRCDTFKYKNKPEDESDANTNEWLEAKHSNLVPMYGNKIKSAEEKAADKEYVDAILKLHNGNTISSVREAGRDGWHYFFKNKMDTAMMRFNQSWLIDSTYPSSYFGFAAIKEYQGMKEEAEKYYQLAYNHDPSDTLTKKYLHQIAQIKEEQKDTLGMIKAYYRVLTRFPKDGTATGKLGFFYSALNQPDSALKYYNLTITFDPDYEQTYLNRGWLYFQSGNMEDAINDYSTAIEKNRSSTYAYANRSNALGKLKRYKEAIADLEQCIRLDPKYPNFNTALAECYFGLNQNKKGCEELDNAIKKGDNNAIKLKQEKCK